jgi:hypothetical protein
MFTDAEIARTTGYIKDDKYIASVYGTNIRRVKRLREQRIEQDSKSKDNSKPVDRLPYSASVNDEMHETSMERGSSRLRDKLLAYLRDRNRGVTTL